jgi:hypothetical protein
MNEEGRTSFVISTASWSNPQACVGGDALLSRRMAAHCSRAVNATQS